MLEKRKFQRFNAKLRSKCFNGEYAGHNDFLITEISRQGLVLRFNPKSNLHTGQTVFLGVYLPKRSEAFEAVVKIKWIKESAKGASAGCKITLIHGDSIDALLYYAYKKLISELQGYLMECCPADTCPPSCNKLYLYDRSDTQCFCAGSVFLDKGSIPPRSYS